MNDNDCPVCGAEAYQMCRCFRRDSECKNGHEWHTCTVHHVKVSGASDHAVGGCSCGQGKVYSNQTEFKW